MKQSAKPRKTTDEIAGKIQLDHTGSAVGCARMDPAKAFYLLLSMVRGLAVHRVVRGDETPLIDDTGTILDIFLTGLKTV